MVQSDVPRSRTQSGKVSARWYLQRLKASAANRQRYLNNTNDYENTIRVVRGSTATQGQQFPRYFLQSPTKQYDVEQTKQNSQKKDRSNSLKNDSAKSLKSPSTTQKVSPPLSELNCNSYQSLTTAVGKNEKDNLSERRSSSGTLPSGKIDIIPRPPSTPVDPRCHRAYSSTTTPIERETCALLGPKLCSDCIQIKTRDNLSAERLPQNLIRQRLSALSIRRFIRNQQYLTDDDLLKMINNQQIKLNKHNGDLSNLSIQSDDEYFQNLTLNIQQSKCQTPFYFKDFQDLKDKYQNNTYERLLLSETKPPQSSNPIFNQSSFEKFDTSSKYSYMKRASTVKPDLQTKATIFISPRKSRQFYNDHRYLTNYSPPLLLQKLQQTVRNNSNPNLMHLSNRNISSISQHNLPKRSLIDSRSFHQQIVQT